MATVPIPLLYSGNSLDSHTSEQALDRAQRNGSLIRVRAGTFATAEAWSAAKPVARHLAQMTALERGTRGSQPLFSHESAAALWGIPIIGAWPEHPQLMVRRAGARSKGPTGWHRSDLAPSEVRLAGDRWATSPLRTAIDLAATRSLASAVAAIDDVRRRYDVSLEDFEAAVAARRPFRGVRRVEAALAISTGLAESPNESFLMCRFAELGFALPEQQRSYANSRGGSLRADFWWAEVDVIGEADGKSKYQDAEMLAGRAPEDVLWAEKVREDELRAVSRGFIRLYWSDALDTPTLARKLTRVGIPRRVR